MDGINGISKINEADRMDEVDEIGEMDGTDEVDEIGEMDGTDEVDEIGEMDGTDEMDGTNLNHANGRKKADARSNNGLGEVSRHAQFEEASLEDVIAQVEHCVSQLENPQIPLEEAFCYYEEGIQKLRACNDKVVQIEQKMRVINSRGELEDF